MIGGEGGERDEVVDEGDETASGMGVIVWKVSVGKRHQRAWFLVCA